MLEDKKHKSPNLAWLGCLLVFLLVLGSVFLGGVVLSLSGRGIIGNANEGTKSPIGVWKMPNGFVKEFRADGTGRAILDDRVSYFEWRLKGNELAIHYFSNPNSAGSHANRVLRGLGLQPQRGSDNYKIVDVTSKRLTLAIDDERRGPPATWERGDQMEYTAVTEETVVETTSVENGE